LTVKYSENPGQLCWVASPPKGSKWH
jgi:hypothetical protein